MEALTLLSSRRLLSLALTLAALLSLAAFSGSASAASYVSLGDSYAAGPFIPNPVLPLGCLKSNHNYPHLVAPATGLTFRDVSCSGADTDDMFNEQGVTPGPNPPQLDALDAALADPGPVWVLTGTAGVGTSRCCPRRSSSTASR